MIGEIRDTETARIAIRASLTGHLVLSTIHTNDAPSAFVRLGDLEIKPYLMATTVKLVLSQRLVRKICPDCKQDTEVPSDILELVTRTCPEAASWRFRKGAGCRECRQTGFLGRTAVFEFLETVPAVRRMIVAGASESEFRRGAIELGMKPLLVSAFEKVERGITTVDEVFRVTPDEDTD
jgi:type II secretory ATPase GspE/PulE/Tfp pilus assembly ATPase PilB-like protein